ncbi:MAG: paraquat-inducible protein A [Phaeospirillum sp.]|nr:paraquat-inducible protein A [Phaeospirillum sp.]
MLYRRSRLSPQDMAPLLLGALVVFLIANLFPIVDLGVQGQHNSTTLFGSILTLWREGRQLVAMLVLFTTLLFPLVELLALLALLLSSRAGPSARLWRLVQALRPWGMVEVFMLGVVVSLVKLSHSAQLLPGPALWAFAVLTVLQVVIVSFDPRPFWGEPDEKKP